MDPPKAFEQSSNAVRAIVVKYRRGHVIVLLSAGSEALYFGEYL